MDQGPSHFGPEYYADFSQVPFFTESTSATSSPSPLMWPTAEHFTSQPEQYMFDGFSNASYAPTPYSPPADFPVVEFTDLTAPYQEDRRRRKSQVKDKQAISSMHMRRRAQNRASQRAFRERKERHAQDLQKQLDELQGKHNDLQQSYNELGGINQKLSAELQELKAKIMAVHASQVKLEEADDIEGSPGSEFNSEFTPR